MRFGTLSPAQAAAITQAMNAVVTARGRVAALPLETDCIDAARRHLLGQGTPVELLPNTLPEALAELLQAQTLRKSTVRLLAALVTADRQISPDKVAVVEDAARRLGVSEFGLLILRRVAQRRFRTIGIGLMPRFVNHYWSYTGRAAVRDYAAILWTMMPWLPGLRPYLRLDQTLARYRALAALPADTLGFAVHQYYATRGFPVPGERKSIPEGWARHEVYHVLANYNTNLRGELLLAGFIAGNTDEMCLDLLLPALVQLHAGITFVPGPTAEGLLRPNEFFRAVARGAAMRIDLLKGWRLWDHADSPLQAIREEYGIPSFTPAEYADLAREDALLVA